MSPTESARSENRSMTESQKPPNSLTSPVSTATLPSMKSKMLATIMITPADRKWPMRERPAGGDVDEHAGERENIRMDPKPDARGDDESQRESCTLRPMAPVKVTGFGQRCVPPRFETVTAGAGPRHRSPWRFTISRARSAVCPAAGRLSVPRTRRGETLYVGKARVLRDRVRSYLAALRHESAHRRARSARPPRSRSSSPTRWSKRSRSRTGSSSSAIRASTCCSATTRRIPTCSSR